MSTATEMRDRYIAAEAAILDGQSYDFGNGKRVTLADLAEVRKGRAEWERAVATESRGGRTGAVVNFSGCSGREGRWGRN